VGGAWVFFLFTGEAIDLTSLGKPSHCSSRNGIVMALPVGQKRISLLRSVPIVSSLLFEVFKGSSRCVSMSFYREIAPAEYRGGSRLVDLWRDSGRFGSIQKRGERSNQTFSRVEP
jgi:hypothetical protein